MTRCPVCGWSRGHDYGCPNDPLNPGAAPVAGMEPVALTGRVHELKTDPEVFQAVWDGRKTFEIRRDDREGGFRVGDALDLRETKFSGADMTIMPEGCPLVYTGRRLTKIVGHRLSGYGLADRWVCLSFASIAPAAPAEAKDAVREEAVAWMDDEGRVFSAAQMENARNHQGGPGKIVAAKYSIPLYAAPTTLRQPEAPTFQQGYDKGISECAALGWKTPAPADSSGAGRLAASEDTKRLDWLLANPNTVCEDAGNEWFTLDADSEPTYFKTGREAIDAARAAAEGGQA